MILAEYLKMMGFGDGSWGPAMARAALVTFATAGCGFLLGAVFGTLVAWAKLSGVALWEKAADFYTTLLRGVPELLVIYLLYFGGTALLRDRVQQLDTSGFIVTPVFLVGALAIGLVSGAYQCEVYRGAFQAIPRGQIDAAHAAGMSRALRFRRIVLPQVLIYGIPSLGNIWQLALKESALISVIGLVELLRQAAIGAGSTFKPFYFYITAAGLFLVISLVSNAAFQLAEFRTRRYFRRPD